MSYNINANNAATLFARQAKIQTSQTSTISGKGIVICAGGSYIIGAYVVVRLLHHDGSRLPIEIWHAGADEIPPWIKPAFIEYGAVFHDIMDYCPNRDLEQMRGFPIKTAALINAGLHEVMFLDADCFPVRNLDFLFETQEFKSHRSIFFPDHKRHLLLPKKPIWNYVDMQYQGDEDFETGLLVVDKVSCWQALNLAEWMNTGSHFWYQHILGDKDSFYLAWRKLEHPYFLAPKCLRFPTILTRHFWTDGHTIVEHRTGTSKYRLPYQRGVLTSYLSPYQSRPIHKDLIDELFQRIVNINFSLHLQFINELEAHKDTFEHC